MSYFSSQCEMWAVAGGVLKKTVKKTTSSSFPGVFNDSGNFIERFFGSSVKIKLSDWAFSRLVTLTSRCSFTRLRSATVWCHSTVTDKHKDKDTWRSTDPVKMFSKKGGFWNILHCSYLQWTTCIQTEIQTLIKKRPAINSLKSKKSLFSLVFMLN